MKRTFTRLFLASMLCLSMAQVKATHLMGGEITARQIVDSVYQITLTVYRDTLGIPMDSLANFTLRDSSGSVILTFQTPQDTLFSGTRLRLYPYGVEVYVFVDTIHLPGEGMYHLSFLDCCRNGAIQNLNSPLNENMYLTTTLSYFNNASNSTPFFLVPPVIFLPVNTTWAYNPLPFDWNGDSLVFSLDTPLTTFNTNCAGYSAPPSVSTNPFSLNAANGSITWTASTVGNFNATVLVDEYRNGVKIGEIRRDMQFIVINTSSSMARMTNMNQVSQNSRGDYEVRINANELYDFAFYAEDPDSLDKVAIHAFGEPFMLPPGRRANFSTVKTGKTYGNEVKGVINWKPLSSEIRRKPYITVYRVTDGLFANDYTIMYQVIEPNRQHPVPGQGVSNGIGESEGLSNFEIFPNPVQDFLTLSFGMKAEKDVNMAIFDLNGQLSFSRNLGSLNSGNHVLTVPIDLESGTYFVVLSSDDAFLESKRIIVK